MPWTVEEILSGAAVILVRPQSPDNVGAVARAMANMGLSRLILVRPEVWDLERMLTLAVRLGREIVLDKTELFTTLAEAVAGFNFVVGASARLGRFRRPSGLPAAVMGEAAAQLPGNKVALVFGPEKDGLTTPELRLCHRLVSIPASDEAASLNLAQAVMILLYELRQAGQARQETLGRKGTAGFGPVFADVAEIQGMFVHLREVMDLIDPDRRFSRQIWLEPFRRLFARTRLFPHEVKLIRGFCRKIAWALRFGPHGRPDRGL